MLNRIRQGIEEIFPHIVEGVMHACGHDFHTSILLGPAYLLKKEQDHLPGKVIFVFQPGEEGGFGARILIDAGLMKDFSIEYIIGQHLFPDIPLGKIGYCRGTMTANSNPFQITITGQGGHAARPHVTIDPWRREQVMFVFSEDYDPGEQCRKALDLDRQ